MPRFPKKEADVVALADATIAGYTASPGDFPSADLAGHQAGVALETELRLTGEPRGDQLEYRVIALNAGGNGVPSDTAAVVL